mgnify:CR=1 FL=1
MALTLHYHPLSSFCWKALIGLYENDTPFTPLVVDLGDPASRAAFLAPWSSAAGKANRTPGAWLAALSLRGDRKSVV